MVKNITLTHVMAPIPHTSLASVYANIAIRPTGVYSLCPHLTYSFKLRAREHHCALPTVVAKQRHNRRAHLNPWLKCTSKGTLFRNQTHYQHHNYGMYCTFKQTICMSMATTRVGYKLWQEVYGYRGSNGEGTRSTTRSKCD